MQEKNSNDVLIALDIGTSKVVAIAARVTSDNNIDIIGIGSHSSRGLKRGIIVNIEATVRAIQLAIEEVEAMTVCEIKKVIAGIAGNHIKSSDSHGIVAIKDREVSYLDIERVIDAAKAVTIPADQKIIHVIPQEFIIDDQKGIKDPLGMSGIRLESNVHIITGSVSAAQNIVNSIRRCNLDVEDIVLEQLASSYAVLKEDEKKLGVCLIDIGGGTTDIAVFYDGAIKHTSVIPIAGDQVTSDIAVMLGTPTKVAERIKVNYGWAKKSLITDNIEIEIPCIAEKERKIISSSILAEVIEPRYEELFILIDQELKRQGLKDKLGAGVVLTGGSSKIKGASLLGREIFKTSVRVGKPTGLKGIGEVLSNPIYSTGVGLLLYSLSDKNKLSYKYRGNNNFNGIWNKFKNWLQANL